MFLEYDVLCAIVTNAPHYVIVLNPDLEIEYINKPGPGISVDELVGTSVVSFLPPAGQEENAALLREVLTKGEVRSYTVEVELPDGVLHHFETVAVPLRIEGEIRGVILHSRDATARQEAEHQRDALQALMEKAESVAHFGSFELQVGPQGEEANLSNEVYRILGLHPAKGAPTIEMHLEEQVHPDDKARVRSAINRALQHGTPFDISYRIKVDEKIRWLKSKTEPTFDEDGRPNGLVGIVRDVTDEHEAEEEKRFLEAQLRHFQKMEAIGTLASGVAHDFNNLLMGVSGCAQFALELLPKESPARHYLHEIRRSVATGAAVTRQLLTFTSRREAETSISDVNAAISNQKTMLSRLLGEDIEFVVRLESGACWVGLAAIQIEQVLMNLAVNARDAMPEGGRLLIETKRIDEQPPGSMFDGPTISLEVSDTGLGMTEETRQRVFEPFFSTKEVGQGTGLGLSTAYGIVHQAGGDIQVESTVGDGSRFRILLPRAEAPQLAPSLDTAAPERAPPGSTVLLVEDEPLVRMTAAHYLQDAGYKVVEASDGEDGLRRFRENADDVDVLVTDVVLPKLNGPLLVDEIRALRPEMKVLFMSAHSGAWLSDRWNLGPDTQLIQKPFDNVALLSSLQKIMQRGATSAPS